MTKSIIVGVTWGPRPESLDQCATRLKDCFSRLADLHAIFEEWFEKRNTPIPGRALGWRDDAVLKRLLEKGINHTDYPRAPIPELGYSMGLWNGNYRRNGAEIGVSCGMFSKYVSNRAVLDILASEDGFPAPHLISDALEALVIAWDPDSGEAYQHVEGGELYCAGYSSKAIAMTGESLQRRPIGRGTLWFDESAYGQFV